MIEIYSNTIFGVGRPGLCMKVLVDLSITYEHNSTVYVARGERGMHLYSLDQMVDCEVTEVPFTCSYIKIRIL